MVEAEMWANGDSPKPGGHASFLPLEQPLDVGGQVIGNVVHAATLQSRQ